MVLLKGSKMINKTGTTEWQSKYVTTLHKYKYDIAIIMSR